MILVSLVSALFFMTLFSRCYKYSPMGRTLQYRNKSLFDEIGFQTIYLMNILTNQGETRECKCFQDTFSAGCVSSLICMYCIPAHFCYSWTISSLIMQTCWFLGGREAYERNSFRILAGFWVLGAMILVNSYSGTVISSLTLPISLPPIRTLEDLVESREVSLIGRSDLYIYQKIMVPVLIWRVLSMLLR